MLIDIMDFDPRIISDGNGYGAAHGVHCNFHYGYVHDVYDEDAKNVAACVQALRHLIAKADSDIGDLEDELAILQCQSKWEEFYEHTDPFEVCCAAFEQRINSMTSAIRRLKNGVDTVSEIERPAEKIADIIDALIKSNFQDLDEQEEDLDDDIRQAVSSDSPNIDANVRQPDTTLELSIAPEQQTPVVRKVPEFLEVVLVPNKPIETISEESSSVATRYTIKDLTEAISRSSPNVKISEKIESAEHASKEERGFLTSVETIAPHSPLQASNGEGNTKPTAPPSEEIQSMGGSNTGESRSPVLVAMTEQDSQDINIQLDLAIEGQVAALENQPQNVSDLEITYALRESCSNTGESRFPTLVAMSEDTIMKLDSATEGQVAAIENQPQNVSDLEVTYDLGESGSDTGESRSPTLVAMSQDNNMKLDSAIKGQVAAIENQPRNLSDLEVTYGRRGSSLNTGESRSPVLVAMTEQDGQDTNIQLDSANEGQVVALESQPENISDLEITYGRRESGLSKILKPSGQKVQRKNLDDVKPFNSGQKLKPQKTIKKRNLSSIENFGQSSSPSSELHKSVRFHPETNFPTHLGTEEIMDFKNPLKFSLIKKRHHQGTKIDSSGIPKRRCEITLGLKSLGHMKVKDSSSHSLHDTLTPEINSYVLESTTSEFDLEGLRRRVSEDPNFVNKLTVKELREILKLFKINGASKSKKDRLIEQVTECLATLEKRQAT